MKTTILAATLALAAAPATAQVTVSDAWVRATAPGQTVAGAYMQVTSKQAAALIGAASPAAKTTELHTMSMDGGVMKMRPVAKIELPAGKPVELKSGGYHVMLIDIAHPLAAGETVPLTLKVRNADGKEQSIEVKAVVRDMMSMGGHHDKK